MGECQNNGLASFPRTISGSTLRSDTHILYVQFDFSWHCQKSWTSLASSSDTPTRECSVVHVVGKSICQGTPQVWAKPDLDATDGLMTYVCSRTITFYDRRESWREERVVREILTRVVYFREKIIFLVEVRLSVNSTYCYSCWFN